MSNIGNADAGSNLVTLVDDLLRTVALYSNLPHPEKFPEGLACAEQLAAVLADVLMEAPSASVKLASGVLHLLETNPAVDGRAGRAYRFAYVRAGKSIELFGVRYAGGAGRQVYAQRFAVGEEAVSGSFNLIYTDPVTRVTAARVFIDRKSMTFERFDSYNWDFDAESIAAHNRETSQSI